MNESQINDIIFKLKQQKDKQNCQGSVPLRDLFIAQDEPSNIRQLQVHGIHEPIQQFYLENKLIPYNQQFLSQIIKSLAKDIPNNYFLAISLFMEGITSFTDQLNLHNSDFSDYEYSMLDVWSSIQLSFFHNNDFFKEFMCDDNSTNSASQQISAISPIINIIWKISTLNIDNEDDCIVIKEKLFEFLSQFYKKDFSLNVILSDQKLTKFFFSQIFLMSFGSYIDLVGVQKILVNCLNSQTKILEKFCVRGSSIEYLLQNVYQLIGELIYTKNRFKKPNEFDESWIL